MPGSEVVIDASASDADTFRWEHFDGIPVELASSQGPVTSFSTPLTGGVLNVGLRLELCASGTPVQRCLGFIVDVSAIAEEVPAGDCNGDRYVTVNELIRAVSIALGRPRARYGTCAAADANANGDISIGDLLIAVGNALSSINN